MDTATPAAPAQPTTPAPISAATDAANKNDFPAFEKAHLASRRGEPLPAVTPAAAAPEEPVETAAVAERTTSKRQQQINDYERRIAEQGERIARLEGQLTPKPAAAAPPVGSPAPVADEPAWKRYAAMPDAPKLAQFDTVEDHAAAMALFIADKRHDDRQAEATSRTAREQADAAITERVTSFDTRVDELAKTDPAITEKIVAVAQQLGAAGKDGGPARYLSDLTLDSPVGPRILAHLHAHPDVLTDLLQGPAALRALPADGRRYRAHLKFLHAEFAKLETSLDVSSTAAPPEEPAAAPPPIAAVPPPPPTLTRAGSTTDPKAAAFARGDFQTWEKLDTQEKVARRKSA